MPTPASDSLSSPFLGSPRIRGAGIIFGIPGVDDEGVVLAR